MQILDGRESTILEYIIRDYIQTARPVSSERVRKKSHLDLSPATIRNAMAELDSRGYLEQPHTSGGRIPTDRGYRYFVDNFINSRDNFLEIDHESIDDLLKITAKKFGMFTVVARSANEMQSAGIDAVFGEPEFQDYEMTRQFAEILEDLGNIAETYFNLGINSPEVRIGRENPFADFENFGSVFAASRGKSRSAVVFSIGPKRRDYEKAVSIINYINDELI